MQDPHRLAQGARPLGPHPRRPGPPLVRGRGPPGPPCRPLPRTAEGPADQPRRPCRRRCPVARGRRRRDAPPARAPRVTAGRTGLRRRRSCRRASGFPTAPPPRFTSPSGTGCPSPASFDDRGRVQRALTAGLAHLHIQTRWNDWFLNPETPALETALKATRARFLTARALGLFDGRLRSAALLARAAPQPGPPRLAPGRASTCPRKTATPRHPASTPWPATLQPTPARTCKGVVAFDPTHRARPAARRRGSWRFSPASSPRN